jgi:hypothetical protein
MRVYASGILIAAALSLAANAAAQADKHPSSIVIMTALPKEVVFDRAASALIGAGYAIGGANAIAITTAKRTFKHAWDLQLSVNVLSAGDSLRIVLTGTYWVPGMGVNNEGVVGGRSGVAGKMWHELEAAADSVRSAVTPAEGTARE